MLFTARHLIPVGGALLALSLQVGPGAASQLRAGAPRATPHSAAQSADTTPPVITGFKVSHTRFRVGTSTTALIASRARGAAKVPTGTTFTLSVSERSTVVMAFVGKVDGHRSGNRCVTGGHRGAACAMIVKPGALIRIDRGPGQVSIRFSGRVGNAPLAPGQYIAGVAAVDGAENTSNFAFLRFIVVPG